jgi:hypothetical protein
MRRLTLPLIAVVLVGTVLGVQVAAGGGRYAPRQPGNPCAPRPIPSIQLQLEPLAEQIVLLGLDGAACRLRISRERLILALAERRSVSPRAAAALKAGLRDAVERLARMQRLPRVSQLLPQALDQTTLPAALKTLIEAIPASLVDKVLPTAPLLRRTIDDLDVARVLRELNNPRQLNTAVRSALLHAALREILDRLHP